MKVFLSSTRLDLEAHRNKATEAIERLGQQATRMEVFGARPKDANAVSLEEVGYCDLFVGIYAYRYGFIPPGSDISITEAEFQQAKRTNRPQFCFLLDGKHPWPKSLVENEPGASKLERLKSEIESTLVRDTFTTPEDLAYKVAASLGGYINTSLIRVTSGLRDLIENTAGASKADRKAVVDALASALEIANRTVRYIARRRTEQPDTNEETELSHGWQQAGIELLNIPNPPVDLANRYFLKAEYWSDPNLWTDERIDAERIRLTEVAEESRELLLGIESDKKAT
ncbi:MAG TPA: DUF4062 domain-containing protein [Pyrinomonadaceae bacterium]|nr:DUF4062 domain-containing protein [Pyrinomonadaceae bacterium]